jgi:hypothetical protein
LSLTRYGASANIGTPVGNHLTGFIRLTIAVPNMLAGLNHVRPSLPATQCNKSCNLVKRSPTPPTPGAPALSATRPSARVAARGSVAARRDGQNHRHCTSHILVTEQMQRRFVMTIGIEMRTRSLDDKHRTARPHD